jgi:6-pyruvoyltetrahydropterin/6-carboxytetrahydropterin synthase
MSLVLERNLLARLPETVEDVTVEVRETSELCASGH